MAYSEELLMPVFTTLPGIGEVWDISVPDHTAMFSDDSCSDYEEPWHSPQKFNQSELNDLVWHICFSKDMPLAYIT